MSRMKSIAAALLIAALAAGALLSCGSSDPKTLVTEGHTAQGKGDSKAAEAKFQEALKSLKPDEPLYVEARLGIVEAMIATDAKKAADEFFALEKTCPGKIGEKEFLFIGSQMVSAKKYLEAVDLLHQGIQRAGGKSPTLLVQIDRIKKEAASDKAVNDKLHSLGYL